MVPSPLEAAMAKAQFNPPIPECDKARWIQLQKAAGDQRSKILARSAFLANTSIPIFPDQKCAECHDFCLPEFGIQGTATEVCILSIRLSQSPSITEHCIVINLSSGLSQHHPS